MMRGLHGAKGILLVEDNQADARLVMEVFKTFSPESEIEVASDGVEAIAMLKEASSGGARKRPDIILLDLNLPRKNGFEVLKEVREDSELRETPVIVLSTSDSENDIRRAYDMNANCYVVKPVGLEEFITAVKAIKNFWADGTARLPQ